MTCQDWPVTSGSREDIELWAEADVVAATPVSAGKPAQITPWTPQRLRIYAWLKAQAPALAPVYEGVVRMAVDPSFPGRVWFVAHAVRDMRNRLPDAIAGPVKGSRTEYSQLAAEITRCWIEDGFPKDGSTLMEIATEPSAEGPERVLISATLMNAVADLVAGHIAIGPRKQERAHRLFTAVAGQPVPDYAVRAWIDTTDRVESFAHLRNKPLTPDQEAEFDEIFAASERALLAMANRSYENMDEIDDLLDSANS